MKKFIAVMLVGAFLVGCAAPAAPAPDAGSEAPSGPTTIRLLRGAFAEIDIIMHMAAFLIEANTDLTVQFQEPLATVLAAHAIVNDNSDLYVNYDGTLLTTLLGMDPSDVPEGELVFDFANEHGIQTLGLMILDKFGFENTYAVAIRQDFAQEHGIQTISDLVPHSPNLVFGAEHEFFDVEGTMRFGPFTQHYGFDWAGYNSMEMALKHGALYDGAIDVTVVFSTDGLNLRFDLAVLEDDLAFFPEYNAGFHMRHTLFEEFAETAPNLEEVLSLLTGRIDNYTMINLNYEVDGLGRAPQDVAREFLESIGLL